MKKKKKTPKSVRRQGVAHAGVLTYRGKTRAVAIRRDRVKHQDPLLQRNDCILFRKMQMLKVFVIASRG